MSFDKSYWEQLKDAAQTSPNQIGPFTPTPQPCPSCGHCPTCGRSATPAPYQPYPGNVPYYPWQQQWPYPTITW